MSEPGELSVASFNLHWGRGARAHGFPAFDVVDAVGALDADVVVLQEAWMPDEGPGQLDTVAAAHGYVIAATAPLARSTLEPNPRMAGRSGTRGEGTWQVAVLSRRPVLGASTVAMGHLWPDPVNRVVHRVALDVGGTEVTVVGTHLPHLEFGALLQRRAFRATLPEQGRAVLAGDMNMWRWCIRWMCPRRWRPTVRGRTFPAHRPHSQIDHVLVAGGLEVREAVVLGDLGSDHRPVRVVLATTADPHEGDPPRATARQR